MPSAICPTCSTVLTRPGPVPPHPDWGTGRACGRRQSATWLDCATGQQTPESSFLMPDGTPRSAQRQAPRLRSPRGLWRSRPAP